MQHKGGDKGVDCSFQVGDMGIGFPEKKTPYIKDKKTWFPPIDENHKFLRGNHDDPAMCSEHPNCVDDFGYFSTPDIFYVSGGYSVDFMDRTPNIDLWENEELEEYQFEQAMELYKKEKPRIMVSHEGPIVVKYDVVTNPIKKVIITRTERHLQEMFEVHQPEFWIFGHHHIRKNVWVQGTQFVALRELIFGKISDCIYEIPNLKW